MFNLKETLLLLLMEHSCDLIACPVYFKNIILKDK